MAERESGGRPIAAGQDRTLEAVFGSLALGYLAHLGWLRYTGEADDACRTDSPAEISLFEPDGASSVRSPL